nr:unnamed protein product [Naegleria fowleri]
MPTTCPYHYLTHLKCNAETCKIRKSYPQNEVMDQRYFFLLKELYDKNQSRRGAINKILKDKFLKYAPHGEEAFVHALSQIQREGINLNECIIKHANLLETVMKRHRDLFVGTGTNPSSSSSYTTPQSTSTGSFQQQPYQQPQQQYKTTSSPPSREEDHMSPQQQQYIAESMHVHDNNYGALRSFPSSSSYSHQQHVEQHSVTTPQRRSPPSTTLVAGTAPSHVTFNYNPSSASHVVVTNTSSPPQHEEHTTNHMHMVTNNTTSAFSSPLYHMSTSTPNQLMQSSHKEFTQSRSNPHRFDHEMNRHQQPIVSFPSGATSSSTTSESTSLSLRGNTVSALKHLKEKYANMQNLEKPTFVNNNASATCHSSSLIIYAGDNVNNNTIIPLPCRSSPPSSLPQIYTSNMAIPTYGQSSTSQKSLPSWKQESHVPSSTSITLSSTSSAYSTFSRQPKSKSPLSDILTSGRHHLPSSSNSSNNSLDISGIDQLQRKRGYSDSFYQETTFSRNINNDADHLNASPSNHTYFENQFGNSQLRSSEQPLNACPSAEFTPTSLSSRSGEEYFNAKSSNVKRRKNEDVLLPSISEMMNKPPHKSKLPSPSQ